MRPVKEDSKDFFYEPNANLVLKKLDSYWGNDTVLAYQWENTRLIGGVLHSILYVPGSGYISERLSLLGNWTKELSSSLDLSLTALVGFYPQDKYLSYKEGKIYGALQVRFLWKLP